MRTSILNALALNILVLINGVKHIEFIRECFKTKEIDGLYLESLEEIEIKLGLREKPKPIIKPSIKEESKPIIKNLVGRNDPCPCGSGKKYKKCCMGK